MGALSMDIPIIFVPAGPMLRGNSRGKILGSGSDQWAAIDEYRAVRVQYHRPYARNNM